MDEYDFSLLISDIEMKLIRKMKANMEKYIKNEEFQNKKDWNRWQIEQLRAIENFKRANKNLLKSDFKELKEELEQFLIENYNNGLKDEEKAILSAIAKGEDLKRPDTTLFYALNSNRFKAILEEANKVVDKVEIAILRSTNDIYRQVISQCSITAATGTPIWQCVDEAVEKFTRNGISKVTYEDGRNVNIASYSEMAIRTSATRSSTMAQADLRESIGNKLVIVSKYNGCSPLCWHVQGKVFFDDTYSTYTKEELEENKYPLLSQAMDGTLGYLFHPNCRHSISSFYPGITKVEDVEIDKEENDERYKLEQQQRSLERKIRDAKKKKTLALTEEYKNKYDKQIKTLQARQRELVGSHDFLRRDYAREKVRV